MPMITKVFYFSWLPSVQRTCPPFYSLSQVRMWSLWSEFPWQQQQQQQLTFPQPMLPAFLPSKLTKTHVLAKTQAHILTFTYILKTLTHKISETYSNIVCQSHILTQALAFTTTAITSRLIIIHCIQNLSTLCTHPSCLHRRHNAKICIHIHLRSSTYTHICAHFLPLSPTKPPPSDTLKSLTFALLCTFTIATLTACMCSANTQHLLPYYHSHVCPFLPPPSPHSHWHGHSCMLITNTWFCTHSQEQTLPPTTPTHLQPHNWDTHKHIPTTSDAATCPQTFPYIHTHTTTLKYLNTHNFMLPTQDHSFSVILLLVANLTTCN